MNKSQANILISIIETHFQFQKQHPGKRSILFDDIKKVLECSLDYAEKFASTHCNMVSFWGLNYSQKLTTMQYDDFFNNMLENNFCNKEGKIKVEKDVVCEQIFGYDFKIKYFEDYEDVLNPLTRLNPEKGYQLKMKGDTSGFHFIACYIDVETGLMMGVDSSYRGTPFILSEKVNPKNFIWLLEV